MLLPAPYTFPFFFLNSLGGCLQKACNTPDRSTLEAKPVQAAVPDSERAVSVSIWRAFASRTFFRYSRKAATAA